VFISMIIVAAIYISSALWWTRKMIVQPLAIIGSHFDSIAAGNPCLATIFCMPRRMCTRWRKK
ncbi:hypothetical protein JET42_00065, partial [Escherichia coli]|nr:hypothetical protein [Escherichia coli]